MQIKAAKSWGYLPTSMIIGKHKKGVPGKWDLLLAEAEHMVESERCPQCGNLRYICQSDDPDIAFQIRKEECHATQAREREEKKQTRGGKKEAPSGVILGADPYTYSGTALDDLRIPFYETQVKQREQIEAARPVRPRD